MHALYDALRALKSTSDSPGSGYSRCARAMHFSIAASLSFALTSVCAPASDTKPATAKPNSSGTKPRVLIFIIDLPSTGECRKRRNGATRSETRRDTPYAAPVLSRSPHGGENTGVASSPRLLLALSSRAGVVAPARAEFALTVDDNARCG